MHLRILAERQPVSFRGHGPHALRIHRQHQPVQIEADVLMGHGEMHHLQQVAQLLLGQCHIGTQIIRAAFSCRTLSPICGHAGFGTASLHDGKVIGCQRLQGKARLRRFQVQLVALQLQRDIRIRQCPQDVDQLPGRHRGVHLPCPRADAGVGLDLDLHVRTDEAHLLTLLADQDVGQNGLGMTFLDDASHGLKRFQDGVPRRMNDLHDFLFLSFSVF